MKNIISYPLSKSMSKITLRGIAIISAVVILLLLFAAIVHGTWLGRFIADMVSPVGLKDVAYENITNAPTASGTIHKSNAITNNGLWSAIAYAVGMLLLSGVIVAIITNHLRTAGDRYIRGTVGSYPWKGHTLFIGYDELMTGTLKKACRDSRRVVVAVPDRVPIVREQLGRYLDSEAIKKVEVVQCNQLDSDELEKRARIMCASRIYVIGKDTEASHDAMNIKTLAILTRKWFNHLQDNTVDDIPIMMVYIRNQSTLSMLQQQGLKADNIWNMSTDVYQAEYGNKDKDYTLQQQFVNRYCEYFNFYCDRARALLTINNEFYANCKGLSNTPQKQFHLVVLGMTEMGVAIVRETLHLAHPTGKDTKFLITMVDDNAYEEMHYFIGRTKELFKLCRYSFHDYTNPLLNTKFSPKRNVLDVEFEFIQCDVAHPRLIEQLVSWTKDNNQLMSLVICTNNSPKNMAVALYLPQELLHGQKNVPTWIYQMGDDSMSQVLNKSQYSTLHTFSLYDHAVEDTTVSPFYQSSREIADYYNRHYSEYGYQEWADMSQNDRWSSIYSVLSMDIKRFYVGADNWSSIDSNDKDEIDRLEHNRWIVEKLSDGFRPTDEYQHKEIDDELHDLKSRNSGWDKDENVDVRKHIESGRVRFSKLKKGKGDGIDEKGIKIHDDIRPYNELDDYTKLKDRIMLEGYIKSMGANA